MPADCWIQRNGLLNEPYNKIYLRAFYWSFQTLTTVGFGDINANGNYVEMIIAANLMLIGTIVQSYLIGNFIGIITSIDDEDDIIN